MNKFQILMDFLLDTDHVPESNEYPEYVRYKRFRVFDTDKAVRLLIVDEFGNDIVLLPEMPLVMAIDLMMASTEGSKIDYFINDQMGGDGY